MKFLKKILPIVLLMSLAASSKLHDVLEFGDEEKLDALLDKGADVNAKNNHGQTILMRSIEMNNKECFDVILKRKRVKVNAADDDGETALHYTAEKGKEAMCRDLLNKKANVNAKDRYKQTPLMTSILFNKKRCYDLISKAKGIKLDATDDSGDTAIHCAASKGNAAICRDLLKKGVNVNAVGFKGRIALHWTAIKGKAGMCRDLLEKGANVNAKTQEEYGKDTSLIFSVMSNDKKCLDMILKQEGVEVNAADKDGNTALHWAAELGNEDQCRDLLEKVNVNAVNEAGETPYDLANKYENVKCKEMIRFEMQMPLFKIRSYVAAHKTATGRKRKALVFDKIQI